MNKDFAESRMAPPAHPASTAHTPQGTPCVLGPTLHFKGELYGEEDLEFQGQLEGSIEHTRSLSIGKEGGVKGNIRAKFVIIEGKVEGDVYASESVSIRQTAKVTGNIFAPRVGIADGAHFTGRIDMNHKGVAAQKDNNNGKTLTDTQAQQLLAAGG
jgi:cytoskeletal protein CcmA (bactofilin family)